VAAFVISESLQLLTLRPNIEMSISITELGMVDIFFVKQQFKDMPSRKRKVGENAKFWTTL
jgi:hypothetical protein